MKDDVLLFPVTVIEAEGIILSEIKETQKDKYHMFLLISRN